MTNKKCAQCGQEKLIEDFSKSYKNLCKSCVAYNEKLKRSMRASTELPWGQPFNANVIQIDSNSPQFTPNPRFMASVAEMQGLLANSTCMSNMAKRYRKEYDNDADAINALVHDVVTSSIEYADALINELSKPKDEVETDR